MNLTLFILQTQEKQHRRRSSMLVSCLALSFGTYSNTKMQRGTDDAGREVEIFGMSPRHNSFSQCGRSFHFIHTADP